jgi:hypothetical protein
VLKGETRPSQLAKAPKPTDPPPMPDDLDAGAALVWTRTLEAIAVTAHIGAGHADTFRHYCEVTAAAEAMQPKGSKEWRELVNIHRQLARELCLTPATGAGLVAKAPPTRKLDRFTRTG